MKPVLAAVWRLALICPAARADLPPLMPRAVLLGNPARTAPQLSPDGKLLAYLAPSDKGVSNVWVEPFEGGAPRMATRDARRGIDNFRWAADGAHVLYTQDRDGDENWHLFAADLAGGSVRDLTPFPGARAQNVLTSPKRSREILVGLNLRDRRVFDMHRVNLDTGALSLEAQNPGDVLSWTTDENFAVRAATAFGGDDAHTTVRVRDGNRNFGDGPVLADMLDAVRWATDRGVADARRVGVMGGSFGGYATLCCLAFHPERFACGVSVVGFFDMGASLRDIPDYWRPVKKRWVRRMGDAEHDEQFNRKVSPLYHVDAIRAPLLIGHGANDPRCRVNESEQIVREMREKGRPVTFVVYPDEGHGFARPENNLDFFGRAEELLAKHLGGRKEPWRKMPGSSADVR